ncbi:hypothetical protein D9M73_145030 [compost metagenome]
MNGLGGVLQQVEQHLLQLVGGARHRSEPGVELAGDLQALEVEALGQVEVVAGDLQRLVQQHRQLAGRHLAAAAPAEGEHVGDDLGRAGAGLVDVIQQLGHLAGLQVLVDGFQADAADDGLLLVTVQLWRQAPADVLHVVQDRAQRVVDLVGHAGGQTTHRKHFLRLHHHLFQRQALGDVIDPDYHATPGTAHQRVESQGVVAGLIVLEPGDTFDLGHRMLLDRFLELRQERLERFEGEEDRLVQGFIETRAGQGTGLLVPLRHVELFVEGDQRRRHGVDDAVEVVLETGELFLDLAAHLDFELQFAVGMAGFLCQTLGLVVGCLGVVPGPLELLLPGLDPR